MNHPEFYDEAPRLTTRDPLAAFLGSTKDGLFSYGYADIVRLAGHSCPAVAGAWLMTLQGLSWLYGDEIPERGGVEVHLRESRDQGVTGVIALVAGLATGAAPETGFGGLGPQGLFSRRGLLRFDAPIDGVMGLRRRDTGRGVILDIDTNHAPQTPELRVLLPRALSGAATAEELTRFAELWQERVRRMLIDHADDPKLIHIYDWPDEV